MHYVLPLLYTVPVGIQFWYTILLLLVSRMYPGRIVEVLVLTLDQEWPSKKRDSVYIYRWNLSLRLSVVFR